MTEQVLWWYYGAVGVIAAVVTVYDKLRAIRRRWRVPEATLLWLGALGGALPMWLVMLLIRHKIRHAKFMLTLPLLAALHVAAVVWLRQNGYVG